MSEKNGTANDRQVGGDHYRKLKIQHWDWAWQLPYLEGVATKYIARHREKGGREDLEKAKHYIDKMIEIYYPEPKVVNLGECPCGCGSKNFHHGK